MKTKKVQTNCGVLIDPRLREIIHKSQTWRILVAHQSLGWVVAKIAHAADVQVDAKVAANPFQVAITHHQSPSPGAFSSAEDTEELAVLSALYQATSTSQGDIEYSSTSKTAANSSQSQGVRSKADAADRTSYADLMAAITGGDATTSGTEIETGQSLYSSSGSISGSNVHEGLPPVSDPSELEGTTTASATKAAPAAQAGPSPSRAFATHPPHVLYIGTFFAFGGGGDSMTSGIDGSCTLDGTASSGSSAAAPSGLFTRAAGNGDGELGRAVLRPELFLCLLYRALTLAGQLPSPVIFQMIRQPENKYLRVFGLLLGRFLFAHRGEPHMLKAAWLLLRRDYRKVRMLLHPELGSALSSTPSQKENTTVSGSKNVLFVRCVDEFAEEILSSSSWEYLVFPVCKKLQQ